MNIQDRAEQLAALLCQQAMTRLNNGHPVPKLELDPPPEMLEAIIHTLHQVVVQAVGKAPAAKDGPPFPPAFPPATTHITWNAEGQRLVDGKLGPEYPQPFDPNSLAAKLGTSDWLDTAMEVEEQVFQWAVALAHYHLPVCDWVKIGVNDNQDCTCGLTKVIRKLWDTGRANAQFKEDHLGVTPDGPQLPPLVVQSRSEATGILTHPTWTEAFQRAVDDPTVWKLSFWLNSGERMRLVRVSVPEGRPPMFMVEDLMDAVTKLRGGTPNV